ncbi:MAG: right-handed parallel beta-helix repeat-containing protein [Methanosphaera sp.]|nr:right-handed parallel beta-helix repeat-containing protein [Methanosphaera sp.]
MNNKSFKTLFLFLIILIALISVVNATEVSDDTDNMETTKQVAVNNEKYFSKEIQSDVTQEQDKKKINKKNDRLIKTKSNNYTVNDYASLHNLLTNSTGDKITVNLNSDIILEDEIILNENLSNLTINGNKKTINGQEKYGFLKINKNSSVYLNNINFKNCTGGVSTINNKGYLIINNLTFNSNQGDYAGSICNEGNLTIENSLFKNESGHGGGSIFNKGNLTCINSIFEDNRSGYGESITNCGNLTLNYCKFNYNDKYYGYFIDTTTSIIINNCEFINENGSGSGINNIGDNIILIDNSTFRTTGYAFYCEDGLLKINNSRFYDYNRSAIFYYDSMAKYSLGIEDLLDEPVNYHSSIRITNTEFKNCTDKPISDGPVYTILNSTINGKMKNLKCNIEIPISSNITLDVPSKVTQNKNVTIKGKFKYRDGFNTYGAVLNIKINNNTLTTKVGENDTYYYTFKASKLGLNNISVTYNGIGICSNSSVSKTFKVIGENKISINKIKPSQYKDKIQALLQSYLFY